MQVPVDLDPPDSVLGERGIEMKIDPSHEVVLTTISINLVCEQWKRELDCNYLPQLCLRSICSKHPKKLSISIHFQSNIKG